jgi:hypothetical protein
MSGTDISFTTTSSDVEVVYYDYISEDARELRLNSHSRINGHRERRIFPLCRLWHYRLPDETSETWERNLRRVLDEMPRTINPASARILADLLTADRAPADRTRSANRRRQAHPARAGEPARQAPAGVRLGM